MRRFVTFGPAFVVLLAVVAALVAVPTAVRRIGFAQTDVQIQLARADLDQSTILEQINTEVRNIARSVEPTVVHIAVEGPGRGWGRERISQGSGWIYDAKGHIVTNAHVVRGMRGEPVITVQFYDGRTATAELVAVDTTTDIAVLRVPANEGIFPARRATGIEVAQGDRVYAFGSPFGFKFSMSEGIISGLGRSPAAVLERGGYTNFIQTDAAVNPGNSGGPLVDVNGRVVGMNVAIATGTTPNGTTEGQNSGISFAIPLDTIESVVDQIVAGGTIAKGYLGIALPDNPRARGSAEAAEEFNRQLLQAAGYSGRGVVIRQVTPGSPAAKAGMKDGDVLISINNRSISSIAAARQLITINRPGDKVPMKVWRDGETVELQAVLEDLSKSMAGLGRVGDALQDYGIRPADTEGGVVVAAIDQNSSAFADGLRVGLVLTQVEGVKVTDRIGLLAALSEAGFVNGRKIKAEVADQAGRTQMIQIQYRP